MLRIADLKSLCMPNIDTSQLSKSATVLDEELSRLNDIDAKQESSWEKAWSFSFNTECYIWEMWSNQVMVSKATPC